MSRTTDTERGARMAAGAASAILNAQFSPLFPNTLSAPEYALWCDVLEAADETIREHQAMREAMRG